MNNKKVAVAPSRVVLDNMPHKQSFDIGVSNEFTKVSGFFSRHTDTKFGIDLATFQTLDMRTMRQLMKQRVWNHNSKMRHVF